MSIITFGWLVFATLIGFLIGQYVEHPYIGTGIGFAVGVVVRYLPKLICEALDVFSDIF